MENIPFPSSEEDSEDTSSFEVSKDSEDEEDDSDKKSSSKPKKNILFGEESRSDASSESDAQKPSLFDSGKEGFFAGLLNKDEQEQPAINTPEADSDSVDIPEVDTNDFSEEFQGVVSDKVEQAEEAVSESTGTDDYELEASASFLSDVGDKIEEGALPAEAIEYAQQESIDSIAADDLPIDTELPVTATTPEEAEPDDLKPIVTAAAPPAPHTPVDAPAAPNVPRTPNPNNPPVPLNVLTPIHNIPGATPGNINTLPPQTPDALNTNSPNLSPDSPDAKRMNEFYYRDGRKGGLLVGGALGYLFGRRRGRIKTEDKLQPEIENRESEIDKLTKDLEAGEAIIRKTAIKKAEQQLHQVPVETSQQEQAEQKAREKAFEDSLADEVASEASDKSPETPAHQEVTPQQEDELVLASDVLAQKLQAQTERISQEAELELDMQDAQKEQEIVRSETRPEIRRDAKTMAVSELLEVADGIMLESVSLRELYYSRKISARNMRKVVAEFLTGTNYEKLLRKSLESVDIRVESSPEIQKQVDNSLQHRDVAQNPQATHDPATQSAADDSLIRQVIGSDNDQNITFESDGQPISDKEPIMSANAAIVLGILAGIVLILATIFFSARQ